MKGVSFGAWNKKRLAFSGQRSGMASLWALRRARRVMSERPSKQVVVESTGAHLTSLSDAVQEKVSSLVGSDDWVERYLYDASLRSVEKIGGFEYPPPEKPGGSPAASTPEVQVSLGLEKGGSPSSVKIVAGILNQAHPNNTTNTILVAVCPTEKDNYQDLAAMLERHLPELDGLMREGVLVGAARRAVRLFFTGDLAALCTEFGHEGPNATQPCLWCKSTKAPSIRHTSLDDVFGTMQGLTTQRTLRDVEHLDPRIQRAEGDSIRAPLD